MESLKADSKCKGWGRGDENKFSAAPSRSACDPVKASTSSSPNKSSSSLDVLQVSATFCFPYISISVFNLNELIFSKSRVNIAWLFIGYTRVIPCTSFSARWTIVVYQRGSKSGDIWMILAWQNLFGGRAFLQQ